MKTLYLLRHAKSDWNTPTLADFDRPLNKRGRRNSVMIGQYMADRAIYPDRVLCSPAQRTRETFDTLNSVLTRPLTAIDTPSLYEAGPSTLLELLRGVNSSNNSVMMIGHNPGIHMFASLLVEHGTPELLEKLSLKYPTGALATLSLSVDRFEETTTGSATLTALFWPEDSDR